MERRTPWFALVAILLITVGLVTLAAPPPAHAFDPQLALALASAAGAIALIAGYLIVSNGREKQRSEAMEGIYTCGEAEAAGPMGCGGPGRPGPAAAALGAPESPMTADSLGVSREQSYQSSPMTADGRSASAAESFKWASSPMTADGPAGRTAAFQGPTGCPGGQAGPMGCGGPMVPGPTYLPPVAASAAAPAPVPFQGQ